MGLLQLPGYETYLGPPSLLIAIFGWWMSAADQASGEQREQDYRDRADRLEAQVEGLSAQLLVEERELQAQPDRVRLLQRATAPELRDEVERLAAILISADEARRAGGAVLPPIQNLPPEARDAVWQGHIQREQERRGRALSDFRRDILPEMLAVERELNRRLARIPQRGSYKTVAFDGTLVGPDPLTAAAGYLRELSAELG
jgi:hypothetical protein